MPWTISEPPDHKITRARRLLEENIRGFSGAGPEINETRVRSAVQELLPRDENGCAYPAIWRGAYSSDNRLLGAAYAHAPYEYAIEMLSKGDSKAYCAGFLKSRRTLGGLAVEASMRGQGLGLELLTEIEDQARNEGVHHLMGFIDARNGGPDFYAKNGYHVLPPNKALPRMGPYPITEVHPVYLSGSWFYRIL